MIVQTSDAQTVPGLFLNVKEAQSGLVSLLTTQKAAQWKHAIPHLSLAVKSAAPMQQVHQGELQQVLDILSPVKSPIKSMGEPASPGALSLDDSGYVFTDQLLGEGMAQVRLAKHTKTGRMVAIKILQKSTMDSQTAHNVTRELMVLGGLHHPNVTPLLQVIDSPTSLYMVMQLEKGGELFTYIQQRGRLPEGEAVGMFRQIVSAVEYCHSQSIVHRDLKPENSTAWRS
ncbi:MAP/microtubule affinity-regulating kinase 3 [Kappamyces sp. JEL0680]|nr:MAP/microtubule affinity-regulating kinase 3 [Kappamyces sp. JEL0680]